MRAGALAALFLTAVSAVAASRPEPAVLTAVEMTEATPESCRIVLQIQGEVERVATASLEDGRFVFDLTPVAWNGPTRRVSPDCPGIHQYRFSQFSRDPLVARFVVEPSPGWSCRHVVTPGALLVDCGGPAIGDAPRPAEDGPTIAVVRGIEITSPVAGFDADALIDRSLGFTPRDMVRDGLPHFGSARDDWKGAPRRHEGIDIYVDKVAVRSVAGGTVVGVGRGARAGGWAKIRHGNRVETVYVHVSELSVTTGDEVARGQRIAVVDGAVGNAVEPQLHFELRLDGASVDPVPFISELASEDLRRKITLANERLAVLEQERAARFRKQ